MLVLSRRPRERIIIGEGVNRVVVTVVEIDHYRVRLGIEADKSVPVFREELLDDAPPAK